MIRRTRDLVKQRAFSTLRESAHLLRFMLALGHSKRLRKVRFVGVTGSAGKTTTKDLASAVLSKGAACHSSPRSMNYPDGIASIILRTKPEHIFCVLEVSGGQPTEMDRPLRLFTPEIAVLTLVAKDHFKAFKSVDEIAAEKAKLVYAVPSDGTAVLNRDDPRVREIGERCVCNVLWIGNSAEADLRLIRADSSWPDPLKLTIEYKSQQYEVQTGLHGEHLALSVLAALGVGIAAGIPLEQAISSISDIEPTEGRMQVADSGDGITFVRDDWKAPHWSLGAPLRFIGNARAQRKIIVIGTLSDYSLSASKLYPKVARQAQEVADLVLFVGPHALRAPKARREPADESLQAFTDIRAAADFLAGALKAGDLVLLKGSNKADHLVRLFYNRQRTVQCWEPRCGIQDFCGDCPRLYQVSSTSQATRTRASATTPLREARSGRFAPVIIGLGNPGRRFENTPHNLGYRVVDEIARDFGLKWETSQQGVLCEGLADGMHIRLFKPEVSINNSGPVIRQFLDGVGGSLEECLLVHDDTDLDLGMVRTKSGGSGAGHKGVQSVITSLGSPNITRIRVGVRDNSDNNKRARSLVLSEFSEIHATTLQKALARASKLTVSEIYRKSHLPQEDAAQSPTVEQG